MDIKQMQYFLFLAQEGNVTRAARQLNIVQPALSMQIAKLEKSLGKQLFYRGSHGMSLTAAGEALALRLAPIVADIDRARDEMAQLDGKVSGRVSLGMITSAAQSTLPRSTAKIAARYPEIHLLVCEGYSETMMGWVTAGQLDIAIVNAPARRLALTAKHILDAEMMLAQGVNNSLRLPKTLSFERLRELDIVIPSRRHGLRRILDDAAAEAGFNLAPRLEIDTLSAICEVVATTDLVTVLPGIALHPALSAGRIRARRLRNPSIVRSVAWVTNPRRSVRRCRPSWRLSPTISPRRRRPLRASSGGERHAVAVSELHQLVHADAASRGCPLCARSGRSISLMMRQRRAIILRPHQRE